MSPEAMKTSPVKKRPHGATPNWNEQLQDEGTGSSGTVPKKARIETKGTWPYGMSGNDGGSGADTLNGEEFSNGGFDNKFNAEGFANGGLYGFNDKFKEAFDNGGFSRFLPNEFESFDNGGFPKGHICSDLCDAFEHFDNGGFGTGKFNMEPDGYGTGCFGGFGNGKFNEDEETDGFGTGQFESSDLASVSADSGNFDEETG